MVLTMLSKLDMKRSYTQWVKRVRSFNGNRNEEEAMQQAIGGEFVTFGLLERELLRMYGLAEDDYVIDVGCGSGRLAKPLSELLKGKYLGTDVVPDLLLHAEKLTNRPDWRFEVVARVGDSRAR